MLDEQSHTAVFAVQGKETRGQGSATATISNRLVEEGDSTRVLVETELSVTGRPAQFGRGIMQDVAASMLDDFSRKLSVLMAADGASAAAAPPAAAAAVESQGHEEPEALRVGGLLGRVVAGRVRALLARLLGRG